MATDILDVICTKRDGGALSDEQIEFFLAGYEADTIADEQASALLMAIVFRGMNERELATWTQCMIDSGSRVDLSGLSRPTVDKHSTGGVGDKVSLIIAPMIAACGAAMPQVAGRGLGHTGGTLDKLEAISGFRSQLPNDEFLAIVERVGCVMAGPADDLAPADRRLYALRDVTGTVESIPLISSSIMSKKVASGTKALVLDVKIGSGAFLPEIDRARLLARTMCGIGESQGVRTVALLTDMDAPLGHAAGNAVEVTESLEVLAGRGPRDLIDVTLALAKEMLDLVGIDADPAATLSDGSALRTFEAMVDAQGGDLSVPMATASSRHLVTAPRSGVVQRVDARAVGVCTWRLGAGRTQKEDDVSMSAGVMTLAKPGDEVVAGDTVLELHIDDPSRLDGALAALEDAVVIGDTPPVPRPLVAERITADSVIT